MFFFNLFPSYSILIGDAGYPLCPWLITPFKDPLPESPEERFNNVFCRARSIIERVNGILKMRFRCLLKHRVLHYTLTTAAKIVNTCAIFHNIAIEDGLHFPEEAADILVNNPEFGLFNYEDLNKINPEKARVNPELAAGRNLRQQIVREWFA